MGLLYGRAGRLTAQNGGFRRGQFLAGITEATPEAAGGDARASGAALARRRRLAQLTPSVRPFLKVCLVIIITRIAHSERYGL